MNLVVSQFHINYRLAAAEEKWSHLSRQKPIRPSSYMSLSLQIEHLVCFFSNVNTLPTPILLARNRRLKCFCSSSNVIR